MSEYIPLSVPCIRGNEWQYIKECLDTEWVSSVGKYVKRFEEDICHLTGVQHAIACVNGTAALHIALGIIGVQENEEVLVPTLTFIAPVNVIRYKRAIPVFMDCDDFYCLDPEKTIDFIMNHTIYRNGSSYNRVTGRKISALIVVHVFGNAVKLDALVELCKERNIFIVEDAAEAIGTYYREGTLQGKFTGTIGSVGCYSFNGNKIITTGGGGMIVTNDVAFANRAKYLTTQAKDDEVRYIHNEIGYNYRLTNIQAALGVAQLEQLHDYIEIKRRNYDYYQQAFAKIPGLQLASTSPHADVNYWLYCMQINPDEYGKDRDTLMAICEQVGIQTRPVWYLNHLQKPYCDYQSFHIDNAKKLYDKTLNIPSSVNLTVDQMNRVIEVLGENAEK